VYEIGSITKTFSGLLIAYAIAEGKMNLNTDIRNYLGVDFSNLQYPNGDAVKLGYVIGHTAQLPNSFSDEWDANRTTNRFLEELHGIKLDTLRAFKYAYSNAGYQLLGYILERLYGTSYENLLQRYITRPLGMKHTTTRIAQSNKKDLLKGYDAKRQEMLYQPDSVQFGLPIVCRREM
jgi:CubicO group peptidase (beta-lactamase class C family)